VKIYQEIVWKELTKKPALNAKLDFYFIKENAEDSVQLDSSLTKELASDVK
jgi:hypothetical protein